MSWPNGITAANARKEYFLTTDDLKTIPHQIPPYHSFGMGRATRYYKPADLKDLVRFMIRNKNVAIFKS